MGKFSTFVWQFALFCALVINLVDRVHGDQDGNFGIGVGIADVTGPAADIGMVCAQ